MVIVPVQSQRRDTLLTQQPKERFRSLLSMQLNKPNTVQYGVSGNQEGRDSVSKKAALST